MRTTIFNTTTCILANSFMSSLQITKLGGMFFLAVTCITRFSIV